MRRILPWLLVLVFVLAAPAAADWREDVDRALAQVAASRADLAVPSWFSEPDTFRLAFVSRWIEDPLAAPGALGRLARSLSDGGSARAGLGALTGVHGPAPMDYGAMQTPASEAEGESDAPSRKAGKWEELPESVRTALGLTLRSMKESAAARKRALAALSGDEREFLEARACSLLIEEPDLEKLGLFELHARETRHTALADSLFRLAARVDRAALGTMIQLGGFGRDEVLEALGNPGLDRVELDRPKHGAPREGPGGVVEGAVAFWGKSDAGAVVVGGPERNVYRGSFAIILDPGGDDLYELDGAASGGPAFQWIFDAGGNDVYRGRGDGALGSGYFGTGVLVDASGDDLYEAARFSIGSAWFGYGALVDRAGDDRYFADLASEGSAGFGVGILSDAAGDDLYQCRLMSQGFGYVQGLGIIDEAAGDDVYLARQAYTDVLRYDEESLTLCQGFGFGERPYASGGIGILHDVSGNDSYSADVYGQGSAYWWGAGALVDDAGNDHYDAHQYVQGAGIHLALGYLLESEGDDRYTAWSCAQGCGHDLGTGLLLDLEGIDLYASSDLSQGAGNANGNGLVVDLSGADGYLALNGRSSQAYGNPRRETQSLGVQVDLAGRDVRAPHGTDAGVWTGTARGVGLDAPAEGPAGGEPSRSVNVPLEERAFSVEELFTMASAGEPRFREWQARGVKELAEEPERSVPYLLTKLASPIARERHTVKDIFRLIGAGGVEPLAAALPEADDETQASGAWVLGEMGRPEAAAALAALAEDASWRVRATAMNALGKLGPLDRALVEAIRPVLEQALADTLGPEFVSKDAAFTAGALGVTAAAPGLCVALGHASLRVRHAAEAALVTIGPKAAPAVEASARRTAAGDGAAGRRRVPHLLAVAGAWGGKPGETIVQTIVASRLWSGEAVRAAGRGALENWKAREGNLPASLEPVLASLRGDSDWVIREREVRK